MNKKQRKDFDTGIDECKTLDIALNAALQPETHIPVHPVLAILPAACGESMETDTSDIPITSPDTDPKQLQNIFDEFNPSLVVSCNGEDRWSREFEDKLQSWSTKGVPICHLGPTNSCWNTFTTEITHLRGDLTFWTNSEDVRREVIKWHFVSKYCAPKSFRDACASKDFIDIIKKIHAVVDGNQLIEVALVGELGEDERLGNPQTLDDPDTDIEDLTFDVARTTGQRHCRDRILRGDTCSFSGKRCE